MSSGTALVKAVLMSTETHRHLSASRRRTADRSRGFDLVKVDGEERLRDHKHPVLPLQPILLLIIITIRSLMSREEEKRGRTARVG